MASTHVDSGAAGSLCVRTKDKEHMSFAKGVAIPGEEPTLAATRHHRRSEEATRRPPLPGVSHAIGIKGGFDYDFRVAADPHRDNKIDGADADDGMNVQDACSAGTQLDSGDSDIDIMFDRDQARPGPEGLHRVSAVFPNDERRRCNRLGGP